MAAPLVVCTGINRYACPYATVHGSEARGMGRLCVAPLPHAFSLLPHYIPSCTIEPAALRSRSSDALAPLRHPLGHAPLGPHASHEGCHVRHHLRVPVHQGHQRGPGA